MRKEIKNKLMPILLMLSLLLSAVAIIPQVSADPFVFPDGVVSKAGALTCGDAVTYRVTDGSLTPDDDYTLIIDATKFCELEEETADDDGNIEITFNVPGLENLGEDPIGTWTLELFDDGNTTVGAAYDYDITISNLYDVRIKYGGDWIDNLIYNTSYTPIFFYAYNWTGSKYEQCDFDLDFLLEQPDGTDIAEAFDIPDGMWDLDITSDDLNFNNGDGAENLEYYLPLTIDGTTQAIPVLLDFTADVPDDSMWGDTISVDGYVKDGQEDGIGGYTVKLYAPANGTYVEVATATTYATGRYYMSVDTGLDDPWSAGTWYIGTYKPDLTDNRVNEADLYEHVIDPGTGFLRYYPFMVESDDSVEINLEDPDEIQDGFNQTLNVTVEWNGEPFEGEDDDAYKDPAAVHITGVDGYNWTSGEEFDEEDYYFVGWTQLNADEDESYCRFGGDIQFNETGTLTIYVTAPYAEYIYSQPMWNNTDYLPNVTGTQEVDVGAADDMNMVVTGMPDEVMIEDIADTCTNGWVNHTNPGTVIIDLYGDTSSDLMNATIMVTGCGLDFTIPEDDDPEDNEYLVDEDEGMYEVMIVPKTGGTLTVTATNDTEDLSVTKDFKVSGLYGTIITSIGDDKEISVESTETIQATVNNGAYATVKVGYYDENWDSFDCRWDDIVGDGETAGEGLDGIFEFEVEEEDIEDGVGYLVVVAGTADLFMFEIIEVAPVHDLTIEVIEPTNASGKDLTVGVDHEDWEFKVYGPGGEVMDDIDQFWGVLIDEDHDEDNPLQTIEFKERSGSRWVPDDHLLPWFNGQIIFTAVNNSGENEHDGNMTFNVDCATVTYMPGEVTAGIDLENFTVEVLVVDANDEPVPDGTKLYLHIENESGNMDFAEDERRVTLDEDGMGEFEIECVGDNKTWINGTLGDNNWDTDHWEQDWEDGNETCGQFDIDWPNFLVEPDTIYIGQANTVVITATDYMGDPIEGINLTLFRSYGWDTPDPVETDEDGKAEFSIEPENSGEANVTIARGIEYEDGVLNWDVPPDGDSVVTDTIVKITSLKTLQISISKSPIWEEETLTITITSDDVAVEDVDVEFAEITKKTDDQGKVTFTVPDPGVDSAIYTITAEKDGYRDEDKTITVIKIWEVTILGPSKVPAPGEQFTITILAKGSPLAGATVTFDGKTYTSGGDGKMTLTAPDVDKETEYTITASFEKYQDGTLTITIKPGGIPGFELVTLIAALGIAFILLRRRR